ncbi:MAG: SRPBCC family protein [Anaerolineales bacterium]
MSVRLQVSQVIDRPVAKVFHFLAREHVRNHPRWDPDIELEQVSEGPIGVGTVIRRRNSRSGTPVEGTMEVVEFEPNRAFGTVIHDGPVEMRGRTTFEPEGDDQTTITIIVDLPGMNESMDKSFLTSRMERSVQNMKRLIESEVPR